MDKKINSYHQDEPAYGELIESDRVMHELQSAGALPEDIEYMLENPALVEDIVAMVRGHRLDAEASPDAIERHVPDDLARELGRLGIRTLTEFASTRRRQSHSDAPDSPPRRLAKAHNLIHQDGILKDDPRFTALRGLNIPTKIINALRSYGIYSAGQLAQVNEDQLLTMRNMGPSSARTVINALEQHFHPAMSGADEVIDTGA